MNKTVKRMFLFITLLAVLIFATSAFAGPTPTPAPDADVVAQPAGTTAAQPDGSKMAVVDQSVASARKTATAPAVDPDSLKDNKNVVPNSYIVLLEDAPVATYQGGVSGFAPTRPTEGKLDVKAPSVVAYRAYLLERQSAVLEVVAKMQGQEAEVTAQYTLAVNGFAVKMSASEAAGLAKLPGVKGVFQNNLRQLDTDVSPAWLGATAIWDGSATPDVGTKGEGVIIGIIDTGINSLHPSFAGVGPVDGYDFPTPAGGYTGWCNPAHPEYDPGLVCNDKLIGMYSYADSGMSPEDDNGHGSHTASTSGGNTVEAQLYGITKTISGMAPHAQIIAYDVCLDGCPDSATMAAIEDAIADGVDVVNFSIGASSPAGYNPWQDPGELAWLGMLAAGIMPVSSAGNNGPNASTVGYSIGAWQMDVANMSHNRFISSMRLSIVGGPANLQMLGATEGNTVLFPSTFTDDLRWSWDVDNANIDGCDPFPASSFDGVLALIERGACNFSVKIANADAAGAVGVVIYNNRPGTPIAMDTPDTFIPSIMITQSDGQAIAAYMAGGDVTALIELESGYVVDTALGDILNSSSSRGPVPFPGYNVIKPDLAAPGTNIWAAVAADGGDPVQYALYSGTSMASPHVAGSYALLKALFPTLTPTEIRSILMSTAETSNLFKDDAVTPTDPFDVGAGRVNLYEAALAGLVLDETIANFENADPDFGGVPRMLNLATIKFNACLVGWGCPFIRTVTNILDTPMTWDVTVDATVPVTVTPATFTLDPGESQELAIDIGVDAVASNAWYFGYIWLTPDTVGSQPVSTVEQHLTLAIFAADPKPGLTIDPDELTHEISTNKVQAGFTPLGLYNNGFAELTWEIGEGQYVDYMQSNAQGGSTGLGSSYDLDTDLYSQMADDFTLADQTEIVELSMLGFSNDQDLIDDALLIYFEVYADDGGYPAATPLWYHYAFPGDPGLDVTGDSIKLDLPTNGAAPLDLAPGTYWVSAQAVLSMGGDYFAGWFWYLGADDLGDPAVFIDNGFFGISEWTYLSDLSGDWHSLAMSLKGITENGGCPAPEDVPWVSFSATSGTIDAQDEDYLEVVYDSTGLAVGHYEQTFCMNTNDPVEPTQPFVVNMEVVDPDVPLACNVAPTRFVDGIPASWTVIDFEGEGVEWGSIADYPGYENYTGGLGDAATVSSDFFGFAEFDTLLQTPSISVAGQDRIILTYKANYQNYLALDYLDLYYSTDGGATWDVALRWNEDHPVGGIFAAPGEDVKIVLDLNDLGDPASIIFAWDYYDPNSGDWDWYAQIDDVEVDCGTYPNIWVTRTNLNTSINMTLAAAEPGWQLGGIRQINNTANAGTGLPLDWNLVTNKEFLVDGGFEMGFATPWQQSSTNGDYFGYDIINNYGLPYEGSWGAWFGGWGSGGLFTEYGTITQTVMLPTTSGDTQLSFWMLAAGAGGVCDSADDYLKVYVDGNLEWEFYGDDPACSDSTWHQYIVDLGNYADGGTHDVVFTAADLGLNAGWSNFFVDNISLVEGYPWLSTTEAFSPYDPLFSGSTNAGAYYRFAAWATTTNMASGQNVGYVTVESNDPDTPAVPFSVSILVIRPAVSLKVTLSTNGTCGSLPELVIAKPGNVTYCYTVKNTGDGPLTTHKLVDTKYGTYFTSAALTLNPGQSYSYKVTKYVSVNTSNTATWTGYNGSYVDALATAKANVTVKSTTCVYPWCSTRPPLP